MYECEMCGDYFYIKHFNWEGKILCLDCFLWAANKHIEDIAAIKE